MKKREEKQKHVSFLNHIAQKAVFWPPLQNNGGSRLGDFPKVTDRQRQSRDASPRSHCKGCALSTTRRRAFSAYFCSGLFPSLLYKDLWLWTCSTAGMLDLLCFDMVGAIWGHPGAMMRPKPLHRSKVSSLIKSEGKESQEPGIQSKGLRLSVWMTPPLPGPLWLSSPEVEEVAFASWAWDLHNLPQSSNNWTLSSLFSFGTPLLMFV